MGRPGRNPAGPARTGPGEPGGGTRRAPPGEGALKSRPDRILGRLAGLIPEEFHGDLLVVGSLAAASHFSTELKGRAIRTKDADFVVQPAGDLHRCLELADRLKGAGWRIRNESGFAPGKKPGPDLPHVKLYSPEDTDFWFEFQGFPGTEQEESRRDVAVLFDGAYYSVPCYRFMGLVAFDRQVSPSGLEYAAPWMMALANLLAHPAVGTARVTLPLTGQKGGLRSAKDLGRAIALAGLTPTREIEEWPRRWRPALRRCFPKTWPKLVSEADRGLDELLARPDALDEAVRFASETGLLSGRNASRDRLAALAGQLKAFAIEPFKKGR